MAVAALKKLGWPLDNEKLKLELEKAGELQLFSAKVGKKKELLNFLLDVDLAKVLRPSLPNNISELNELDGPFVLQLTQWINVSHSIIKNHQGGTGVCRYSLSDGYSSISGFSDEPLKKISGKTPYGAKIHLKSAVKIEGGLLVLNSSNTELFGGEVTEFKNAWINDRMQVPPTTGLDNAPKWVSVGSGEDKKKEADERSKNFSSFKYLKETPWITQQEGNEETEANVEFKRKRKAAVNAIDVPRKRPKYMFHRHW